jgi:hypothetical protein
MWIEKSEQPVPAFNSSFAMRLALVVCVSGVMVIGFTSGVFEYIRSISQLFLN